jgi:hypothetical protein
MLMKARSFTPRWAALSSHLEEERYTWCSRQTATHPRRLQCGSWSLTFVDVGPAQARHSSAHTPTYTTLLAHSRPPASSDMAQHSTAHHSTQRTYNIGFIALGM